MNWKTLTQTCRGQLLLGWAALTLVALLGSAQMYLGQIAIDRPIPYALALRRAFENWYSMGVLAPMAVWLINRLPYERSRRRRWVAVHVAGGTLFGFGSLAIYAAVMHGQISIDGVQWRFGSLYRKLLPHYLCSLFFFYWLIIAAHQSWRFYRQFREREEQARELQRQLAEARLQALRMQLNPHFLFNTLHTISALVHENPAAADRTIARFSELLRQTLNPSPASTVSLGDEIDFLRRYLEIEQVRFGERLGVELAVPGELRDARVPPLILQPIVENAVRHGIEQMDTGGRIWIRTEAADGSLRMRVEDNGPGFEAGSGRGIRQGIGLANTRARLEALYPGRHRFDLGARPGGGAAVLMEIPLISGETPGPTA